MNVKIPFVYGAIAALIFGLLFVVIPEYTLSMFDISLSNEGNFFIRLFGASLFGIGVMSWLAKDAPPSDARRHIILGEIFHSGIASIIFVFGFIQGIGNLLMIAPFLIHLSLTLWWGYLYIKGAK
jgi:hypothetical protein